MGELLIEYPEYYDIYWRISGMTVTGMRFLSVV
jgi:hypothetical protein